MRSLRIFLFGGLLSYRALFNWIRPSIYIPTMLGKPLFQMMFFTYLGRYSAVADDRFFIVGNAVQASAIAGIFGMVMSLANEREFGTLSAVLATPANRVALFFGRAVPVIANGLFISLFVFGAGIVLLGFRMPLATVPALAATVALTIASCAMFGLAFGSVALRVRDLWVGSNLTYVLMLLVCGVNVPLSVLPGWLAAVGRALPLTHGIEAARQLAAGADMADVAGLIGREALIGSVYAAVGYGLLRLFETESRRRASLDRI
ncbi:MAG: type transport system permease protein [Mycobacteriales bacterium]|jgi:ABC-2 type transport system permease protein